MTNFGLTKILQCFKKLASEVKTKTCKKIDGHSELTLSVASTNRSNIKRIMVFGDSNAFRPRLSKTTWPRLLEDKDPHHLIVLNESCDGRTTRYDLGECNGLSVIGTKLIAHKPLDYVVVMLGTNDVKNKYGPPSPAEIAGGMHQILEIVANHGGGARPILLTPPPLGDVVSGDLASAQRRIPPVAAGYRLLARNLDFRIVDIHSIIDVATDLEPDMVHLNAAGRRKVANAVLTNLQGMNPHDYQSEVSQK